EVAGLREPRRARAHESGERAEHARPYDAGAAAERAAIAQHRARQRDPARDGEDAAEPAGDGDLLEERDSEEDDGAEREMQRGADHARVAGRPVRMNPSTRRHASAHASLCQSKLRSKKECGAPGYVSM